MKTVITFEIPASRTFFCKLRLVIDHSNDNVGDDQSACMYERLTRDGLGANSWQMTSLKDLMFYTTVPAYLFERMVTFSGPFIEKDGVRYIELGMLQIPDRP